MKLSVEIKAAIIAIVIIVTSLWGFNFLKGKNLLKSTNEYYAVFSRIDGIVESGNVLIKGYKVGNITTVDYDHEHSGKFIVRFILEDNIEIPKGTEVMVKTSNLIASAKDLELVLGDSDTIVKPGDTLKSGINPGLSELLDPITNKVDNALLELDSALNAINQLFNKDTRTHLQNSLSSLDATLFSIKEMAKDGGDLNNSIKNLNTISGELASKTTSISNTIDNVEAITDTLKNAELRSTVQYLDSTLIQIHALTAQINSGKGTAGKLVTDSTLYVELAQSMASLDSLLIDMKENPKRYVHFSLFGKN